MTIGATTERRFTTPIRGPLARLDHSRDELAKAWLVRRIERASLDEIRALPTERIVRELPALITDIVRSVTDGNGADPYRLTDERAQRAAALAYLCGAGREPSPADVTRELASLQTVLIRALCEEMADSEPERFADVVERLADATGAVQAAAVEALLDGRARELAAQADTDPLTGLSNLAAMRRGIAHLAEVYRRYQRPYALLILDVDGLGRINDCRGRRAGDRVLMQVAASIRGSIRSIDSAARLGGDELCVLAPEQDLNGAAAMAERLAAIGSEVPAAGDVPVGVSLGVASCPEHGEDADALIDTADRAMYRAKAAGEPVALGERTAGGIAEEVHS